MSVQSEINRIETAKAAIGTAIAGKGVAVPSGTKLDGMAALIANIEQGGGGSGGGGGEETPYLTELATGTFTGNGSNKVTINGPFAKQPKAVLISSSGSFVSYETLHISMVRISEDSAHRISTDYGPRAIGMGRSWNAGILSWTTDSVEIETSGSSYVFKSGRTYYWAISG